jgi:hypothetical protein
MANPTNLTASLAYLATIRAYNPEAPLPPGFVSIARSDPRLDSGYQGEVIAYFPGHTGFSAPVGVTPAAVILNSRGTETGHGTAELLKDGAANFQLQSAGPKFDQGLDALSFLATAIKENQSIQGVAVTPTGHSLGGANSIYVGGILAAGKAGQVLRNAGLRDEAAALANVSVEPPITFGAADSSIKLKAELGADFEKIVGRAINYRFGDDAFTGPQAQFRDRAASSFEIGDDRSLIGKMFDGALDAVRQIGQTPGDAINYLSGTQAGDIIRAPFIVSGFIQSAAENASLATHVPPRYVEAMLVLVGAPSGWTASDVRATVRVPETTSIVRNGQTSVVPNYVNGESTTGGGAPTVDVSVSVNGLQAYETTGRGGEKNTVIVLHRTDGSKITLVKTAFKGVKAAKPRSPGTMRNRGRLDGRRPQVMRNGVSISTKCRVGRSARSLRLRPSLRRQL